MRTIFVDNESKCHAVNDGTMLAVQDVFFDGKCDAFIEGYCYDTSKGYPQIYPWKPFAELDKAQRHYEQALIVDMRNALAKLGVVLND